MLEVLCGSKNMKKILIFLFVNGKCYGTQLQRSLKTSLTPIQKTLLRLEKGGVIISEFEGKTRIYKFNPSYPLLEELEQLLKKSYTILPAQEKKQYCYVKQDNHIRSEKKTENERVLRTFWERLIEVKEITFYATTKSKEEGGWNGKGKGEVIIAKESDTTVIFNEKGSWKGENNREVDFTNIFRWTIDHQAGMISLEHLRRGVNHPVFLFYLVPTGSHTLASIDSHLCGGDAYFGQIFCDHHGVRLNWRVIGPKKNEELDYYYS